MKQADIMLPSDGSLIVSARLLMEQGYITLDQYAAILRRYKNAL